MNIQDQYNAMMRGRVIATVVKVAIALTLLAAAIGLVLALLA
jgi:hypothetical protein